MTRTEADMLREAIGAALGALLSTNGRRPELVHMYAHHLQALVNAAQKLLKK